MAIDKHQFAINSLWKVLEQFSAKGISMLVSIVLARILLPRDYGLIALTSIFTNLSDILIDGGFSTALIQKESIDDYDYSAVFSISFLISSFLYAILFCVAPFISVYYSSPELKNVLRVVGLTFFLQSFTAVRNGIVIRNMQFRLLFVCNLVASITSGLIGIIAAKSNFGVWALVLQRLTLQIVLTTLLFIKVKWRIRWRFDWARIRQMLSFSLGVVGSSLLNYMGGSIFSVVIGRAYSLTALGYYDKGSQLPMQFSLYTFGSMSNVLLPTLASSQSDLDRIKHIVRKVVGMTSFLIIPMMIGLSLVSKELIVLLFTSKWLPAVRIMQCACLYYLATPYMLINIQVFFALGHSGLRVKTECIRLFMMIVSLMIFGFYFHSSIESMAFVSALIAVVVAILTFFEVNKLIDYKLTELLIDVRKPVIASILMGLTIMAMEKSIPDNIIAALALKVGFGVIIYGILALFFRMSELNDIIQLLSKRD